MTKLLYACAAMTNLGTRPPKVCTTTLRQENAVRTSGSLEDRICSRLISASFALPLAGTPTNTASSEALGTSRRAKTPQPWAGSCSAATHSYELSTDEAWLQVNPLASAPYLISGGTISTNDCQRQVSMILGLAAINCYSNNYSRSYSCVHSFTLIIIIT